MEGVVDRGTAKSTQIEGYTIAAKTGTAAKLDDGVYSKQKYNSSIVGFFPSRKPVVTVLVVIDSPRVGGYYGGVVAGPVFKRIVEAAIQHIGVPRSIHPEQPVMVARHSTESVTPVVYGAGAVLPASAAPSRDGVMPDLRGLSARSAARTLARAGFMPRLAGQGVVTAQDPMAGTALDPGTSVRLWLDREPPTPLVDPATQP
jgi:cell division protein FtsI (penicillin-binding protein 3)